MRLRRKYYGIVRCVTVGIAFALQIILMLVIALALAQRAWIVYMFFEMLSILTVFEMVYKDESYKLGWVLIILILPVAGFFLYFMWGRKRTNSKEYKRMRDIESETMALIPQDRDVASEIQQTHPNKVQISRYLMREGYPIYRNTSVDYFEVGEDMINAIVKDLKNAKKFILLEYFIVSEGRVWNEILEVLTQKAKEGVEVKLLFDDFGTVIINTKEFREDIKSRGIDMLIFNSIHKDVARLSFNYRNHQKIAVIDGNIGYTGGINLADEYANYIVRFGHWKDTGVRLAGEGVWSMTCMFWEMWRVTRNDSIDYDKYRPDITVQEAGFVQPFAGGPHRNPNNPVEGSYTRMVNKARDYIYITTPYLVLDQNMQSDLINSARSGVDVRIIVPGIPDKKVVYIVNVSNYGRLMEAGVRIYEYKPGFIHAKNIVADDECAICGTINTDYRSFYHHYECGVFLSEIPAVMEIKDDFVRTLEKCQEIDLETWKNRSAWLKVEEFVFKLLSPML